MTGTARVLLLGTADTNPPSWVSCRRPSPKPGTADIHGRRRRYRRVVGGGGIQRRRRRRGRNHACRRRGLGRRDVAMTRMAEGAAAIARNLFSEGRIDGMLALGGTMGTDLALDVASVLPLGMPKFIVSTVAHLAFDPAGAHPAGPDDDFVGGGTTASTNCAAPRLRRPRAPSSALAAPPYRRSRSDR